MTGATALGGTLEGGCHRLAVRVYYEDTDFSGAVYHASYLRFMERGRTEFLRAIGLEQQSMLAVGADPLGFVVRRMTIDFLRPARMDDVVTVVTTPTAAGGAAIVLAQQVLLEGTVLVEAEVKVAAVAQGRARRLPRNLHQRIMDLVRDGRTAARAPETEL